MIEPEDILKVMGNEAKKVCSKVFPQERPNATMDKLTEFVVVSLPYSESNKTIGEDDDWWLDETVVFEIYVADKKSANDPKLLDTNKMKQLRSGIKSLFPIVDKTVGIKITRPRVVINASSDGNGYHYSRVQGKMTTMI
ncbi:hypothetical protein [Prevotella sp. E2-28]|uniref:hypothetical protein n=1 Tax=Prevotella sp. E2-28 TaxID=2913620 RepID=UPI001EDA81B6|nr:hypothetical protein [Prevotella sp. E2-28]UKK52666.1 hypothetical protein L6465_08610 [Prevotella sp. E2-28]